MIIDYKICPKCDRKFYKKYNYSKKYWKKQKYCSIECSGTLLKKGLVPWNKGTVGLHGADSPSYKGGRNIGKNGYVRVLIEGKGSYMLEHRKVMENYIGRKLEKYEVVHHINHNRQDNRLENLEILDKRAHDSMETKRRWIDNPQSFRLGGF